MLISLYCVWVPSQINQQKQLNKWSRPACLPVLLVDLVSKAHCVHDGQLQVDVALLQVIGPGPQVDVAQVVARLVALERRVEQRVD